jgi:predicted DNA-binding ribbon-helix-helix protein
MADAKPRSQSELRTTAMENGKRLSVALEASTLAALKRIALEQDTSVAELIRVAIARVYKV